MCFEVLKFNEIATEGKIQKMAETPQSFLLQVNSLVECVSNHWQHFFYPILLVENYVSSILQKEAIKMFCTLASSWSMLKRLFKTQKINTMFKASFHQNLHCLNNKRIKTWRLMRYVPSNMVLVKWILPFYLPHHFVKCFSFVAHHPNNTKFQVPKCPIHGAQWKLCNGQLIPPTQSFVPPHLQRFPHWPYANNDLPWMVIFLGADFYYFRKQSARTWNLCFFSVKYGFSTKNNCHFFLIQNLCWAQQIQFIHSSC